jgi:hypothetical protein
MLVQVVLPFGTLVATRFQRFYQPLAPGSNIVWTANDYVSMLDYRFFGLGAATLTTLLVSFLSWQVVRWPSRLTQAVSMLAFFVLFIGTPPYGTLSGLWDSIDALRAGADPQTARGSRHHRGCAVLAHVLVDQPAPDGGQRWLSDVRIQKSDAERGVAYEAAAGVSSPPEPSDF